MEESASALIGQILAGGRPVRINGAELSQCEEKVQVLLFHTLIFSFSLWQVTQKIVFPSPTASISRTQPDGQHAARKRRRV